MFVIYKESSKELKGITDALSAIIDETYFVVGPEEANLTAMDESHICLMHMVIPKAWFTSYECDQEDKVGLNLEDLVKIMKRAGGNDSLTWKHPTDSEKFQVQMKGAGTRTFSLRLVDIDEEKIPPTAELDVDFDATFTCPTSIIEEAIKDAEIYQDTLEIKTTAEGISFSAEGEVGDIQYELDKEHLEDIKVKAPGRGVFSLAFLKNIMKISALADKVSLSIADNAPLKFQFLIPASSKEEADAAKISYWLAPRVEENEDSYESD